MQLIMFSKMLKEKSVPELIAWAHEAGLDGFDLCVRPGYPVNPDNAATALTEAVAAMRAEGVDVPMVTGNFDLLWPDHPTAEPILDAMDRADVRLLKLGYYKYNPKEQDYEAEVERIRRGLTGWQCLAWKYGVKVCYHTHSKRCMGGTAGMLRELLRGFDPACIGAYLDPGHLCYEGEEFAVAAAMVRRHFSILAVKDVMIRRVGKNGHGATQLAVVPAGEGMVDWTAVFDTLGTIGFDSPISVHCEFHAADTATFLEMAKKEIAFFRQFVPKA